jgi:hypothetical protein
MENTAFEQREPRPGFSISEKPYGDVLAFNFNLEFAQRLRNVLNDLDKAKRLQEPQSAFLRELNYLLDEADDAEPEERGEFLLNRFNHVFMVGCTRDFGYAFAELLGVFVVGKNVSPALFSFVKQFQAYVLGLPRFKKEFQPRQRYADE